MLTLNIAGLSEGFTFDAVDATIWPLNGTGALQQLGDGKVRQWNFGLTQGADEASLADFASITDYEVNNAQPSVPEFTTETPVTTSGTTLSLQLTITKGTENVGCFVGLESLRLYNSANEGEEGEEPAEEGTYTVDLAHGAFGTGNATGTYFAEWASTAEPTLSHLPGTARKHLHAQRAPRLAHRLLLVRLHQRRRSGEHDHHARREKRCDL